MTPDEHKRVIEICVETAAGRVPVIAGAGSNTTAEAIDFTRHAENAGADAALVVAPYYNKPTQEGLYQPLPGGRRGGRHADHHLQRPGRAGRQHLGRDHGAARARLHEHHRRQGRHRRARPRRRAQRLSLGKDFIQLSGEDATALGFNAHGGVGCISVTANVAPRLCAEFQDACR